ncbi:MAG: CRISPR-associated endonuclease Cas3'' [Thermodesulfovibrio aggregans]|uniref:CRISPR-associated endonuclease Cas3 n=1 Tax=Thermodesulfovibrio aggregans TaxID=86166 RepID=A0A2J6WI55_9BACT|nr:MAG: CRISPR-associated endonuclease Cas3'' [Thermodesulfovibrio aggregans]
MTHHILFKSAPDESYTEHIEKVLEKFEVIYPLFEKTILRIFNLRDASVCKDILKQIVLFHDLGKLTKKWQENLRTNKKLPSHAPIGAGFLYKKLTNEDVDENLKNAVIFAIAIHHTDSGLLGDNIERPDVQAIVDGIADFDGNIDWHKEIDKLDKKYFPNEAKSLKVADLKDMARDLRVWAKGCRLLEQHQRRLQAYLIHHILKLCDISAAVERKGYLKEDDKDYYGGWLMVEDIVKYVNSVNVRR